MLARDGLGARAPDLTSNQWKTLSSGVFFLSLEARALGARSRCTATAAGPTAHK